MDRSHKYIVTFFRRNRLEELHHEIIEDILEENFNFLSKTINVVSSKSVNDRKYFIIPLPYDNDSVAPILFFTLYKDCDKFEPNTTYCIENNIQLPITEMLCFILADKNIYFKICQNIVNTPEPDQIPIILE